MALSDEERRLLAQMEAALAAEDPRLATTLRGSAGQRRPRGRRAALAGLGVLVGIGLLVVGMQSHWIVSVLGFLAMLASAVTALGSTAKAAPAPTAPRGPRVSSGAAPTPSPFMDKMEERWRRRQYGDQ